MRVPSWLTTSLVVVGLSLVGCGGADGPCGPNWTPVEYPPRHPERVSIIQGVWGDVWFWKGDFMPFCGSGTVIGVGRELRIHEAASETEVVGAGRPGFVREVKTGLVATVWSDAQGFFQAALPAGVYSVFTVEDSVLYWHCVDEQGHLDSFQVQDGKTTEFHCDIKYEAYE